MAHLQRNSILQLVLWMSLLHSLTTIHASDAGEALTRIVGSNTIYEPIPYQISFQILYANQWRHFCSGAIISANHFLTAAHCVNGQNPARLSALAGVTNLKSSYGSRHYIQSYKIHQDYTPLTKCDIAIVTVKSPFILNGITISAISFADTTPVLGGVPVVLTGWGSTKQNGRGPIPDNLQVLITNTFSQSECRKRLSRLQDTELCTFRATMKGACNGDSGGPLVSYDRTKLVGIVSFGSAVCASGYPDFFTRVSAFVGWIRDNIN